MSDKPYAMTHIDTVKSDSWSTAPNGSARCHDFYTTEVYLQTWTEGQYAGYTYKIEERYISPTPEYRGQRIGASSTFHAAP